MTQDSRLVSAQLTHQLALDDREDRFVKREVQLGLKGVGSGIGQLFVFTDQFKLDGIGREQRTALVQRFHELRFKRAVPVLGALEDGHFILKQQELRLLIIRHKKVSLFESIDTKEGYHHCEKLLIPHY